MRHLTTTLLSLTAAIALHGTAAAQATYTLQQLRDSALHNNLAIRTSRHDMAAAQEQRREAFTKYFPNISAAGAWMDANKPLVSMDLAPLGMPTALGFIKNGSLGSVTAMQPVFAGGQIVNGNRLAKVGEEVSRLQMQLSEQEVEKTVEQYYWQMVTLLEKKKTLLACRTLLSDIHKDVQAAVSAGVALRNDLLQVQLRQNEVESQELKLRNGLSLVRMLLAQYCGLQTDDFNVDSPMQATLDETAQPPATADVSALPEYQLLEKQAQAASIQRRMERGKLLPTVAVGAGYSYNNLMDKDMNRGMLFATVRIPLSDWWGGSHAVRRRTLEYRKAQEQLADNTQLLHIRRQKAWNDVTEARSQVLLAQRSTEQAQENLRIQRNCYQAGTVTMSHLLEAQLLLQQSLDRQAETRADYRNHLLEYRHSMGLSAAR